jgi:hypothetical protein
MLMDIIGNTVASQPDMEIVASVAGEPSLLRAADRNHADVVVLARNDPVEGEYDELLYGRCTLKVIEIGREGRHGSLYELRPYRVSLGEMSPTGLLQAIRASTGARRAHRDH